MSKAWFAALALLAASCGGNQESAPRPPAAPAGERLRVEAVQLTERKPVAAEVATRHQAEALARIPGRLVRLSVQVGDNVTRGQLIGFVVDERIPFETSALAAQIAAAAAEAERANAELSRAEYLYGRGFVARTRLDQARADARAANAQLRSARALRSASASASGQGAILAPSSGRVLRADIPEGSVVTAGSSVATITSGPPLLRLHVPQSLAQHVRVGTAVTVQDEDFGAGAGRVVQLYPAASGGQVIADAELAGLSTDLVGRRVSVMLEAGARTAIVIPRRFLVTRFGVDFADILGRNGAVTRVPVQAGPTASGDRVEILSGLSPGDVIVAAAAAR